VVFVIGSLSEYRREAGLRCRLPGVKISAALHSKIKALKGNTRFAFRRHFDPGDLKSQYRELYSQAASQMRNGLTPVSWKVAGLGSE
jgi:hypothetical protein